MADMFPIAIQKAERNLDRLLNQYRDHDTLFARAEQTAEKIAEIDQQIAELQRTRATLADQYNSLSLTTRLDLDHLVAAATDGVGYTAFRDFYDPVIFDQTMLTILSIVVAFYQRGDIQHVDLKQAKMVWYMVQNLNATYRKGGTP